jgi:hypothetical protein
MHRIAIAIVLALGAASAEARPEVPPEIAAMYKDPPVIELVTMGVGSLIWERHGHIALCVRYADPREDACYNYGIADFHEPLKMTWGFFRGTNSFWVGKMDPQEMLSIYRYADRAIWVQPLPLTPGQKQQVIAKLEHDILEENKYYAYDHFEDNCTTRIRDIIDQATGGALSSMPDTTDGKTYRDLAREGFFGMRIPLLTTDIAMGRSTDRVPTYYERMFLPQYLREAVAKKFGIQPIPIYERKGPPPLDDGPSGRVWLAIVIVLLTVPVALARRYGRLQRTALAVAIAPYALLGATLAFLAAISPLPYVHVNETCLVWFPFDLAVVFLAPERARLYARLRIGMLALIALLLAIDVLHQPLFAPLLWPLLPMTIVGFWRPAWTRAARATAEIAPPTASRRAG